VRERVEDVLFNRRPDATERLVELAGQVRGTASKRTQDLSWRQAPVEKRLEHAWSTAMVDFIEADTEEARQKRPSLDVISARSWPACCGGRIFSARAKCSCPRWSRARAP